MALTDGEKQIVDLLRQLVGKSGGSSTAKSSFGGSSNRSYDDVSEKILRSKLKTEEKIKSFKEKNYELQKKYNKFEERSEKIDQQRIKLLKEINERKKTASEDELRKLEEREKKINKIANDELKNNQNNIEGERKKQAVKDWSSERIKSANVTILGEVNKILSSIINQDSIMSKLASNYSLTRTETGLMKKNILDASIYTATIGVSTEDLVKLQSAYTDQLGRSVMFSSDNLKVLSDMSVATGLGVEGTASMVSNMELFGLGVNGVNKQMQDLVYKSREQGLSTSVMAKKVEENLKYANTYTFKGGVKGLMDMTLYSSKLRINMSTVASLADKVSNPEGAIQTAASLQVLGGAFANLADPINLMYQSINDMGGLTQTYSKMLDGIGQINKKTGEAFVGGYDKIRVKAAAEAMGTSYEEAMDTVMTKIKRKAIKNEFSLGASDETKDLIASLAQFNDKTGKYEVSVGGKTKAVASLSPEDIEKLQPKNQELNIRSIAENTLGLTDIINNGFAMLTQTIVTQIVPSMDKLKDWVMKGVNYIAGILGVKPSGESDESYKSGSKARGGLKGAMIGGGAGAIAGAVLGTLLLPGLGTGIGAALGGLLLGGGGAWVGNKIGQAVVDDAIYDSANKKLIKLNNKDQIIAMKPGGAISNALTKNSLNNNTYGQSLMYNTLNGGNENSSVLTANQSNLYSKVSSGYSNTYNGNGSNNGGQYNINVSGVIRLDAGNSSASISASELLKNKAFVREITRMISNQKLADANGGKYGGKLNANSI